MMLKLLKLIHLKVFIMWYTVYLIVLSVCSDLLYEIFYIAYHDFAHKVYHYMYDM